MCRNEQKRGEKRAETVRNTGRREGSLRLIARLFSQRMEVSLRRVDPFSHPEVQHPEVHPARIPHPEVHPARIPHPEYTGGHIHLRYTGGHIHPEVHERHTPVVPERHTPVVPGGYPWWEGGYPWWGGRLPVVGRRYTQGGSTPCIP